MSAPRVPLTEIPEAVAERITALGGRPINLYRALANQPAMLATWAEFAWGLRTRCATPRRLRELMIVRLAHIHGSEYELAHHRRMAAAAGAEEAELAALAGTGWREANFSQEEKAALSLAEAMAAGGVDESTAALVARYFDPGQRVELALTAAAYCAVPRLLDALGVALEDEPYP